MSEKGTVPFSDIGYEGRLMPRTIGVIGALEKEVALIRATLEDAAQSQEAGLTLVQGTYRGLSVVATTAGMGTVNAAAATQHLISCHDAKTVIFSGIAGGLNPALHVGDVVVGGRLRALDTDTALIAESTPFLEEFSSTKALVELAEQALAAQGAIDAAIAPASHQPAADERRRYLVGTIATGNRYVTGAEMRARVIAASGADCVEMEGAAVAQVAAKNGVDCLVLRAISDNCDEAYDALSSRQFDLTEYAHEASALVLAIIDGLAAQSAGAAR